MRTANLEETTNERVRSAGKLAFFLLGALAVSSLWVHAQISPGPLAEAHSPFDALTKCTSCHTVGAGGPRFKCLDCHEAIRLRIAAKRGYHAKAVDASKQSQDCIRCHTDHAGRNFQIIRWPKSREEFDHRETGYALEGKHAGLSCDQCHKPDFQSQEELRALKISKPDRTYFGLTQRCASCHEDVHQGQLGQQCSQCHTANGWKPASGFDHDKTSYPLTGAHQKAQCADCHKTIESPKPHVLYKGLAFGTCDACHKDPHRGSMTGTCQSCHTTENWKRTRNLSSFDHSRTKFPLVGKHQNIACAKCHATADFKRPVAHALCMDCHRADDPHNGQFRTRSDQGECASCHNEEGWKPSTFTLAAHQKIGYKLVGKHESVACEKCHIVLKKVTQYRLPHGACKDCHADAHAKQFTGAPNFDRCENCHNEQGFHPSTFLFSQHQKSRFPLSGSHGAITCDECHKPMAALQNSPSVKAPARFHWDDLSCTGCHEDPHRGQLESDAASRAGKLGWNCTDCHVDTTWAVETKARRKFDHSTTAFPLAAAHSLLACGECHRPSNPEAGIKSVIFNDAPKACAGCHEDVHGGQFAYNGNDTRCEDCHGAEHWKPSLFDHFSPTTFSLAGAHQAVRCKECHSEEREIGGRKVAMYKGTPSKCDVCHAQEPDKAAPR